MCSKAKTMVLLQSDSGVWATHFKKNPTPVGNFPKKEVRTGYEWTWPLTRTLVRAKTVQHYHPKWVLL